MHAAKFKQLLDSAGLDPGNVVLLADLCNEWFAAVPSITSCILRSMFQELAGEWDDPQGIPSSVHDTYVKHFLPPLVALANLLQHNQPGNTPIQALDDLVLAYRQCRIP